MCSSISQPEISSNSRIQKIADEMIEKRSQINQKFSRNNNQHMCAILTPDYNIISYGYNIHNVNSHTTEHAEEMALRKLYYYIKIRNIKHRVHVILIVIKTSGKNSKPCGNCIKRMSQYSGLINIRNIYYTTDKGEIYKDKLSSLMNSTDLHFSSYYRNIEKIRLKLKNYYEAEQDSHSSDTSDTASDDEKYCLREKSYQNRRQYKHK
jgi:cytidine deaminase